ncbi:hypothetical protein C8T65DRAFT_738591 [Cerioporus squamosus]|nr:hypothetical protein C8T65DRAFT_738591 [Cerioporus squamosus]
MQPADLGHADHVEEAQALDATRFFSVLSLSSESDEVSPAHDRSVSVYPDSGVVNIPDSDGRDDEMTMMHATGRPATLASQTATAVEEDVEIDSTTSRLFWAPVVLRFWLGGQRMWDLRHIIRDGPPVHNQSSQSSPKLRLRRPVLVYAVPLCALLMLTLIREAC